MDIKKDLLCIMRASLNVAKSEFVSFDGKLAFTLLVVVVDMVVFVELVLFVVFKLDASLEGARPMAPLPNIGCGCCWRLTVLATLLCIRLDELNGLLKNGLLCWRGAVVFDEENVLKNIEDVFVCVFIVLNDEFEDEDKFLFECI